MVHNNNGNGIGPDRRAPQRHHSGRMVHNEVRKVKFEDEADRISTHQGDIVQHRIDQFQRQLDESRRQSANEADHNSNQLIDNSVQQRIHQFRQRSYDADDDCDELEYESCISFDYSE